MSFALSAKRDNNPIDIVHDITFWLSHQQKRLCRRHFPSMPPEIWLEFSVARSPVT